jgi:catechol 2,3-dioxygenase-like lactoylglutathione lyase family enzyme
MLSQYTPVVTLPTKDLSQARSFYEQTLGLSSVREGMGGLFYNCGDAALFLYESAYAGTNKATAVSFDVPEAAFQEEVDALRGRGVEFMTFEGEGMTWNDGVATMGESVQSVWFYDPDGNIINVSTGEM